MVLISKRSPCSGFSVHCLLCDKAMFCEEYFIILYGFDRDDKDICFKYSHSMTSNAKKYNYRLIK